MSGVRFPDRGQAGALTAGAVVVLGRAAALLTAESRRVLKRWVTTLAGIEFGVDLLALFASLRWWRCGSAVGRRPALGVAAVAAVVHAVRVAIFLLGRTPPLKDFDVRPEYRAEHDQRWKPWHLWFAGTLSASSLAVVFAFWRRLRRRTQ